MIQASSFSCSAEASTTSLSSARGMTTAPSSSTTMTSSGNTATPPQPIGCCQLTNVRPATDGGAAAPLHQTGKPVPSTPATSRTTPSVTSAATPRTFIRAQRMSPKIPASVMPMASTTAMQPGGMASMAARVETGELQDSGVARSSRTGTKRSVNAGPTKRFWPGRSGLVPRSQTLRRPFFSSTVVSVAVAMEARVAAVFSSKGGVISLLNTFLDTRDHAAVDANDGAGHIGRTLTGEKRHHVTVFLRLAQATERYAGGIFGFYVHHATVFALGSCLVKKFYAAGGDAPRKDDIRGNAVFGDFPRQCFGPSEQGEAERIGDGEIGNGRLNTRGSAGDDPAPMPGSHIREHAVGDGDDREHHGLKMFRP